MGIDETGDPFGTAALRAGVLAAWRDSPTRLREDAATEADLVRAGYRDRVLTELAQNAADAAAKAGVPGRVSVWFEGQTLHVANTGVTLDTSGVHALTALRASSKTASESSVGQFGVGFTAVLAVSDEVQFRSGQGSVRFSRADTWEALRAEGIRIPDSDPDFAPPALRLAWPSQDKPAAGFDSEVVLRVRDDVDIDELLTGMRGEAVDLLLELPALRSVQIGEDEITSAVRDLQPGDGSFLAGPGSDAIDEWALPETGGGIDSWILPVPEADTAADEDWARPVTPEADDSEDDWALPVTGSSQPGHRSVGADFSAAEPDRSDGDLDGTAAGFGANPDDGDVADRTDPVLLLDDEIRGAGTLAAGSVPEFTGVQELRITGPDTEVRVWWQFRTAKARWLIPIRNGRPVHTRPDVLRAPTRSDEELSLPALLIADVPMQPDRRRLLPGARLAEVVSGYADFARSLPVRDRLVLVPAAGFARSEADSLLREAMIAELREQDWLPVLHGPDAAPRRASAFTGVTTELAGLLADIVEPLVVPELSGRQSSDALAVLDVHRIGLARIAELSNSLEREPRWWFSLYAALEAFVTDPLSVEELGALAVPLVDGRLVTGPRTTVLDDRLASPIPVHWARLVHPEAAHELLGRLGALPATAQELLNDPALRAHLEDDPGDPDTVDAVLGLAAHVLPAPGALPSWLGLIELPSAEGELLHADELLLPDAPLARVLLPDSPFATISDETVRRYGVEALRAVGVNWSFTVVAEADPTGPDHDLDDEDSWWDGLAEDPPRLLAVRDLDLVDDAQWPEALRLLLSDEITRPLLADRDGYTAWWLRHHAHIDGIELGVMRHPDDRYFQGLLPQLPGFAGPDLTVLRGVLADPDVITPALLEELVDALADPARVPVPEAISQTYSRMAEAAAAGLLDLEQMVLPSQVRALSGAVIDSSDALVLDQPWFGLAVPADRLVVGDLETAPALAELLDLPLVSEAVTAEVLGQGRATSWSADPLGVLLRLQFDLPRATGDLVVHEDLRVRLSGAYEGTVAVPWWREGEVTHVQAQPRA
ncbi:sacsin N-terminal ATP-binding-like domain-containing protein [Nocardia jejuensis]|uniref:sacsin N-terminal ATP-binding-like domain-containing protein n=1 Tax=Nocardia jejuensis TaxID=328049 RepID=UPI000833BAAA|nr:molecular chaperone Hsp90 [Nocardia jejuensis]